MLFKIFHSFPGFPTRRAYCRDFSQDMAEYGS
jgi:hypothetical protein